MLLLCMALVSGWHAAVPTPARASNGGSCTMLASDANDDVSLAAINTRATSAKVVELRREREDQVTSETPTEPAMRPRRKGQPMRSYKLFGTLPPGFDPAPVERLIARRISARARKHYSEADRLQRRVLRMGVRLDDRRRTWSLQPGWQRRQEQLAADDERSLEEQRRLEGELDVRIRRFFDFLDVDASGEIDRTEVILRARHARSTPHPQCHDPLSHEPTWVCCSCVRAVPPRHADPRHPRRHQGV